MSPLKVNIDEIKKFARNPDESPVVMLNLLKFREQGGAASYARYMKEASSLISAVGGRMIYLGKAKELINGDETWDVVLLVQYPSRKAFLKMANDPEYLKISKYREDALERAVLYATDEMKIRDMLTAE